MKSQLPLFIAVTFCLFLSFPAFSAAGQEALSLPAKAASAGEVAPEGEDLLLLMDCSGSMKKTDPGNYRKAAAGLFISLLGDNDRIGVISFGDTAKVLLPLTENRRANRRLFTKALNRISSLEFSTNIPEGVRKGLDELGASERKKRVMLLMSDGKLALGSQEKDEAASQELSALLPVLAQADIKLYTIAFTALSDMKLLGDMAQATGGFSRLAETDKDLHLIFASIFEKIRSPDTIPLEGEIFTIDKDINEATVLVTKKEGAVTTLIDPSGKKNSPSGYSGNIAWYGAKAFDLITIRAPAAGGWRVKLSSQEGNKVYVITDLRLMSSFDRSYAHRGELLRFSVWLERDKTLVTEKDVIAQVTFKAALLRPDGSVVPLELKDNGQSGDRKAGDLIYSTEFSVGDPGEYEVRVSAESKTFKREKSWRFKATAPPAAQVKRKAVLPKVEEKASEGSWGGLLIRFGIINAVLLIAAAAFCVIRKKTLILYKLKALKAHKSIRKTKAEDEGSD